MPVQRGVKVHRGKVLRIGSFGDYRLYIGCDRCFNLAEAVCRKDMPLKRFVELSRIEWVRCLGCQYPFEGMLDGKKSNVCSKACGIDHDIRTNKPWLLL